ncbi:hypothetical protein [Bacterioplanoides sp.]
MKTLAADGGSGIMRVPFAHASAKANLTTYISSAVLTEVLLVAA